MTYPIFERGFRAKQFRRNLRPCIPISMHGTSCELLVHTYFFPCFCRGFSWTLRPLMLHPVQDSYMNSCRVYRNLHLPNKYLPYIEVFAKILKRCCMHSTFVTFKLEVNFSDLHFNKRKLKNFKISVLE